MKTNRFDSAIQKWIEAHTMELFLLAVTVLAVLIRCTALSFVSGDMHNCLLPWFDKIAKSGIRKQIGNYNTLYQTIIYVMTKLPIPAIVQYKWLSGLFDFFLAGNVAFLLRYYGKSNTTVALGYTAALFLPPVVLNSAVWGQCDSIYTAFVILTLNLLLRKRYAWAFFAFGVAFSFKLQAVFIVPFLFYLYFRQKSFSVFSFCFSFLGFYLPCLPAVIRRGDPLVPLRIYLDQVGWYKRMFMNYPSFWTLIGDDYDTLSRIALLTTVAVLGMGMLLVLKCSKEIDDIDSLRLCIFSVWSCLLFLPAMHERYGYMLELLLLVLAFLDFRGAIVYAVPMVLTSCSTYGHYLFETKTNLPLLACISLALYLAFSLSTFTRLCRAEGGGNGWRHQRHVEEKEI